MSDTTNLLLAPDTDAEQNSSGSAGGATGNTASTAPAAASLPATPATEADAESADGSAPARSRRRAAGRATGPAGGTNPLTGLVLSELQSIAAQLGISGTGRMRKGQLIEAIQERQNGSAPAPTPAPVQEPAPAAAPVTEVLEIDVPAETSVQAPVESRVDRGEGQGGEGRSRRRDRDGRGQRDDAERRDRQDGREGRDRDGRDRENREGRDRDGRENREGRDRDGRENRDRDGRDNREASRQDRPGDDDEFDSRGRRRRGRFRDRNNRNRRGRDGGYDSEPQIGEDDVLVPVAGLLDILDSYAFVRTSGYLPGPDDVYVSLAQVRRYGLRKGDAITGAVKQTRDGEKREKFNALARLDTVNDMTPDQARGRVEFAKLTPLYPQDRLRLETEPSILTTRIIDLVAPIGKGQRGLIVSPPKAGKTMLMQAVANAITRNNPEVHLMVVLVDERPEEVTDMQRSVKGEVIASTFDRPAEDHTIVAELSIERAKRLVELGHDVVILLDNITRLGRAYNLAAPASGRILSGGVDSTALYPPKRFFGAARNVEHGGSLTILATALVETGSRMDEVIFEEFKGTGNMELKLDRKLADKRIFPAVDVDASGTRREEILMGKEELSVVWKLRRVMSALDQQQAIELVIGKLKQTGSNAEFLMQVQKTMPVPPGSAAEAE